MGEHGGEALRLPLPPPLGTVADQAKQGVDDDQQDEDERDLQRGVGERPADQRRRSAGLHPEVEEVLIGAGRIVRDCGLELEPRPQHGYEHEHVAEQLEEPLQAGAAD